MPGNGARLSALAFEISPALAGIAVGAFVGVVGFIAVLLIVGRGRGRARPVAVAHQQLVAVVPRYATFPRDTPLPPQAFPASRAPLPSAPGYAPMPFVPSTELSARAFAKMGYAVPAMPVTAHAPLSDLDAPDADPQISVVLDELDDDDLVDASTPIPPAPSRYGAEPILPPISVAPVVVLAGPPHEGESAPHPLGIIKATSSAMRVASAAPAEAPAAPAGASMADFAVDDSPTEIGETFFDEPPQPRRRSDPPRIRPISPAPPRFPSPTPPLPRVTPPPPKVVAAPRS